jgi:hypothetical protein
MLSKSSPHSAKFGYAVWLLLTLLVFAEAMERLRSRYLNIPLTAVLHPASFAATNAAVLQRTAADDAPAVQEKEVTAQ